MDEFINKTIHMIGIGGTGMSPLARLLLKKGLSVSGSDIKESVTILKLKDLGAKVFYSQEPSNVRQADVVVVSSAIKPTNPEWIAAKNAGLKIMSRAEMLSKMMDEHATRISIVGTHGKTTTASMTTRLLQAAGKTPTYMLGSELADYGGNSDLGSGDFFVAESDESDGSFLSLHPTVAIATNIEAEHMDFYRHYDNLIGHFDTFFSGVISRNGVIIANQDNADLMAVLTRLNPSSLIRYGLNDTAHVYPRHYRYTPTGVVFELMYNQNCLGEIALNVHGTHNLYNALATAAFGLTQCFDFDTIRSGLEQYYGSKRRFQWIGEAKQVAVYDDYAHHPTEIATTLNGIKKSLNQRLICIVQPHRYSRVKECLALFPTCFKDADRVVLTGIYSAQEPEIEGVSTEVLKDAIQKEIGDKLEFIPKKSEIAYKLVPTLQPGDIVVTMGAGDIFTVGKELLTRLSSLDDVLLSKRPSETASDGAPPFPSLSDSSVPSHTGPQAASGAKPHARSL